MQFDDAYICLLTRVLDAVRATLNFTAKCAAFRAARDDVGLVKIDQILPMMFDRQIILLWPERQRTGHLPLTWWVMFATHPALNCRLSKSNVASRMGPHARPAASDRDFGGSWYFSTRDA